MRYERQFQRQQERTYAQIEKKQVLNMELTKKVLSAFTALSFIANPFAAVASEIVRQDGTKETFNNKIADIYANEMINGNKTGVNKFSKFDVSANDIANMYFNQQGKNVYADNLVNLVGSKINIAGTVNAIKQNKIGGNLFFLSSDGMAVTNGGVVNAGTLTVLTPNQNTMTEFMQGGNESKINEMVANPSSVALNKSGTITVDGTINTTNGMNLRTGHTIDITKNGTLRSGVTDFAQFGKIVNIKKEDGTVVSNDLKATQAPDSGDIILSVDASEMNAKDESFNKTMANGFGLTENNTVEAKITQNGTIDSNGDVVLAANATSEKQRVAQTVSQIDVNGNITGKTVDIAATSKNVFEDDGQWDKLKEVPMKVLGSVSVQADADYAVLKGRANVNINKNSVVEATGSDVKGKDGKITQKAVRIHADSTVGTQVGAKLSPFKLGNVGNSNAVPATAVAYVQTDNDASTTVNGTIKSKDSTEISADANSEIVANASTKTEIEQGNPNLVNAAVLVVNGKNTSYVTVGQDANLQKDKDGNVNLDGNVDIHSKTTNSLEAKVSTSAKDKSALATAVNVINYSSDAQTNVQAGVTAGNDLAVRADNIVEKNTVITNNGIGSSFSIKSALKDKFMHSKTFNQLFDVKNENSFISQAIKEFGSLGTVGKKFQDGILSPTSGKFDDIGKTVSIGGAVQYVDEQNTSKVKIGAVPLKAGGDATLAAKTDIQDTRMNVISQTHNSKDDSQIKGAVSTAVLYSEMDNTSAVVVEGGTDTKHADISGANVAVTATTTMPYNRVKKLIEELNKAVQDVKDYYAGKPFSQDKDYQANIKAIEAAAKDFESVSSDGDVGDKLTALSNAFTNLATTIDSLANRIVKDGSQVPDAILVPYAVLKKTIQFTGTDQYANFYVRTIAKDGDDKKTKLTAAGSVNINSVVNNSNVLIGKNAAITATKKATVASSTKGETVSFTGNASKFLLPGNANSNGGGASVAFEQFGGNSTTIVAEGAVVRGANVAIDANNSLNRTGIVFSAGTAGENGLSGMVDIMTGDSNAITLVDDEAVVEAKKAATITASNDTVLTNVAGGFMKSESVAIGAGAAVNWYDTNTIAGIVDTDAGIDTTLKTGDLSLRAESDNKVKKAQKLSTDLLGLSDDEKKAYLGDSQTKKDGQIKAHEVAINSTAAGTINSVAVAGAVSKSDDSGEEGFFDRLGKKFDGLKKKVTDPFDKGFDKLDNAVSKKIDEKTNFSVSDAMNSGGASQGATNNSPVGQGEQSTKSSVNVSGAGSVAVNIVNGQTSSLTDGAKITLLADEGKKENGSFTSKAADDVFIGAWGGAAAINWVTAKHNSNTSVGIGGTAAANDINRDVASIIRNTSFTNAGSITNSATKEGALVSAGLGMAVSKAAGESSGTNVAGSVGVSYNNSDSDVHALLIDNQVQTDNNAKTAITNSAANSDVQVTGGVSASVAAGGKSGYGAGGSIIIGNLKNDVESGMLGGTYKNISSIENDAVLGTKQIGAGLGVAVSTSNSGGTFSGVGVYNELDNTAHALIDGATITASGTVSAEAYDTNDTNKHESYIANRGLDATGASYKDAVAYGERNEAVDGKLDDTTDYYTKLDKGMKKNHKDGGNTIVTGALAISGSGGKGGIGAAVTIDDIKNTITSNISNATITADTVKSDADTDTVLVGVAAGGAGSNKFGGVGSVSWQMVNSAAKATISSSHLTANAVSANAVNDVLGVNVAGQVSAGKTAVGMALAYHGLENQTGAYIKGTDITAKDKGVAVTVQADNKSQIVSIGAGVGAATENVAVNGSVAINRGSNSTEAVIDQDEKGKRSTIKKANHVTVAATDTTTTTAVAGGVTVSKNVAVGGAVAYNEVGGLSSQDNAKKQQQQAVVNNTDITTVEKASVQVSATDKSKLTTVGAGVGIGAGQTGVAVQGAAATALVNKNVEASMTNTNIDKDEENAAKADVSVSAGSNSTIVSNASVVAVGTTGAAIGAGVAVNRINQATTGAINGGTMHVDNAAVTAHSNANITNIGIGGAVAGKGAAVTGNVAVNMIDNDVTAHIGQGANITANRNVGIIATSDDVISNYAGTLNVAGQGAGVGISTSVNEITGSTQATVGDENDGKTKVTAKGNGDGLKTNTAVADNEINDTLIDRNTIDINAKINRTDEIRKGVIVDATATHTTKSFLANASIAGQGAGVAPTVNVNTLGGDTTARVTNSILNGGAAGTAGGDVTVTAADYANSSGFVGTVGAAGQGAGIGLGSDTNTISRTVAATIEESEVKANTLAVDADSKQGISSYTIGAAVAGQGAGVTGVVNVTKLDNATKSAILDSTVNAGSVAVKANHKGIVNAGDFSVGVAGMGAGVGASVGVVKDESTTEAIIGQTKDKTKVVADSSITVNATNETVTKPKLSANGIGIVGAGAGGAISVNNMNSTVKANVINADLQAINQGIGVKADNTFTMDSYLGSDAAGAGGIGASVSVNTIDSTVQTNVSGSKLTAGGDIDLDAVETRNITQLSTNAQAGIGALGANIALTTVGKKVEDQDALASIEKANGAYGNDNLLANGVVSGALQDSGTSADKVKPTVDAETGGKGSQITVNVAASNLQANKTVSADAKEQGHINMTLGGGSLGAIAANAGVGKLDVNRNVAVNLSGGTNVSGQRIALGTDVTSKATMNVYQGSAGLLGVNAALGEATTAGNSVITIGDTTLSSSDIDVLAQDNSQTEANTLGITVGGVTVGIIGAAAKNQSNTIVDIKSSSFGKENANANINIGTNKNNSVTAHATGGSGGVVSGTGVEATAEDSGENSITLGNKGQDSKKNTFTGQKLTLSAVTSPAVKAIADSISASLLAGGAGAVATAKTTGGVGVTVYDGNELNVDEANIKADAYAQANKKNTEAYVKGNSGAGGVNTSSNAATATTDLDVHVAVGAIKGKEKKTEIVESTTWDKEGNKVEKKKEVTTGLTALNIQGQNSMKTAADARGITVGGVFASGNNKAVTENTSDTNVSYQAGTAETKLGSLTVSASGAGDNLVTADGSGGGLISTDQAAHVKNTMNSNVNAVVSGSVLINGDVSVRATQNDTANLHADALKATAIGMSGTRAENSITGLTDVNLNDSKLVSAGAVDVDAANTVTLGNMEKNAVEGSGYGGITGQSANFSNTITKNATVNVGNGSLLSYGKQLLEAKSEGNITAGGYIKAAGAGAFTWVDVDNQVTSNNAVIVGEGGSLKTAGREGDITLAAVDNMDITARAVADTQGGAAGGASADVTNTLHRNNQLNINGSLYSSKDLNLYAGKDSDGRNGKLNLNVESEAYNKTLIAVAKPKLKDEISQNNNVTLGNKAVGNSVRNINLYADAGDETIRDTAIKYTWYDSDKDENYTSSTVGDKAPDNKNSNNYVQVDGSLTAGIQNKQNITIGNKGGQLVFLNKDILDGVKNYGKGQEQAIGGDALKNAIDVSDGIDKDTIEVGTMDYGSTLFDRYKKLSALVKAYSEDEKSAAYLGYLAEQQRILDEMKTLGILETIKTPDGKSYEAPVQGMTVDYISLPDIIASGGNISIKTDTLHGAGSMEAKGAPEVMITNNTNLYLKVGNVTVGDPGGEIHFNNVALSSDLSKAKDQIRTENSNKDYGVNFSKIALDGDGKTKGKLTIEGNYGGQTVFAKVTIKDNGVEKEQVIQVKPKADIEINGVIQNNDGSVSVTSKANNIVIQGNDVSSTAGVKGKDVHLSAAAGSISQGYSDDITSIGGKVQDQYGNQYQTIKNDFNKQYGFENTQYIKDEVKNGKAESGLKGTMIAGEAIYLTAADININGYMQSGYAAYDVTIDDKAQAKIDSIKQKFTGNANSLADQAVTSGTTYLVVEGKDVLDAATGSYKRQLPVYYNPSTDKLIVPDVDSHGGKIYLTGRISSTGNGTIKALDGAYDITVKNNTDKTLQLGKLVSNDVEGLIRITDAVKKNITEMTRDKTVIKDLKGNQISSTKGAATTYKPEEDLRYNWTTGQKVTTSKTYQNTIKAGLWGLVETMNEEQLTKFEQSNEPIKKADDETITKPNGEYIGKINNDKVNNSDFSVIYNNTNLKDKTNGPGEPERWSTGFLGWFKWERYTWTRETSTSQQYVASVKADKAINIGFIGNADGNSKIDITSKGDINVGNTIAGSNSASTIKLESTNGSITQNGINMVGDNIELHAATGMKNIGITSIGDTVNLTAQNTTSGDMGITVNGAYGKAGNVQVGSITNTGNSVSLTADGNITKDGADTAIIGSRIDLISKNGTIGTDGQALLVQGGTMVTDGTDSLSASVNAAAKGNINIAQNDGDMRIGRVYSDQGDVTVTVKNGNLVDALPSGETIDRGDTDKLIQKWKDLGLVEGEGAYKEQQERDVTSYKDSVKAEYNRYNALKKEYENNRFSKEEQELYDKYAAAKGKFESLSKEYQTYKNQAIYYADDSNRPKADNYRTTEAYEKALATYNKGKTAFDKLQEKCQSYADANAYIKASMGDDDYNNYTKPTLTKGDETIQLKTAFDNYSTYTALKDSYGSYKTADAYLESPAAQAHIKELRQAGAQWNQDQLLYAIQDAVINPASGSIDQKVKDPNVKGKNITLRTSGSVGLDSDTPKEISLKNIGSNVDALKQLANADAATVKWDAANHKAIITEKSPIGIQTTSRDGKLTIDANKNVYISGRTEHNETIDNAINIGKVKTDGDIRIQSKNGITNLHPGTDAALIGKNILLQGGAGNLGKADAMLTLDASGVVQATGQDIYLNHLNGEHALQLKSLGGNGDIVLQAAGDIVSADEEGTVAQGYIKNEDSEGTLTLKAGGSVGTAGHALRIMNADDAATKQTVSVQANKNVYLQGLSTEGTADAKPQGTLFLKGLTANGTVHVGDNGSIQVTGPMINTGSGDITIKAEKDIAIAGDVTSQAAAILSARGNVNLQSGLLQAEKVNLVGSAVHNPNEQAGAGKITQSANSRIVTDKVVATAMNGIDLSNKQNTLTWIDVWNMGQGDINIANDGAKDLTVIIEKQNDGNVTVHNYKTDGKVSNMSVESQTDASGVVTFQNDAGTITTPTKDTYIGEATGKEVEYKNDFAIHGSHVVVQGTDGVTNIKDIVSKGQQDGPDGTVEITSKKGDIQNGGDITADKNVLFETTGGNITMNGNIIAKDGDVTATTDKGNITTEAGKTISASKDVSLKTDEGTIDVEGTITAGNDATVQTQDGSITVKGDVTAKDGAIRADVGTKGDIVINGNALAKDSIIAESQNGKITFDGNVKATEGNVSATTSDGDITFAGTVDAKTDIEAATETNGNITFNGAINAGRDLLANTKTNGGITIRQDATAEKDISLNTNKGDILFDNPNNKSEDIVLQSNKGNVNLNISTAGSIRDTHHEVNGDRGIIHANQGNVTVLHNGKGDVDLQEIYAKGDNKISVADGDLHLVNVSGKLVAILVKNPDKKMDVENVEAATQIAIAGSNMDLENITQRKDGDGYLVITPEGTSPDKPINSLKIGNIKTDTGVRFDRLWVNTGDITVNKGAFLLDKVYVLDKATFSNGTVKTNVFGSAPKREEGVTNTYWNNTAINKPQDKLGEWLQPGTNDAWAYLYFTPQGRTQYGTGHLLDLWQDYYVFSKRYTEADWMRILSDADTYDFYGTYYQPELSYHDRYNLITGDGTTAANASEKDISID